MSRLWKNLLVAGGIAAGAAWTGRALLRRSRRFSFAGKSVLVTGASRGLGLVMARQLADAGARVAICARTEADLDSAEVDLRGRGAEVLAIPCDVSDREQVQQMVDRVIERWGALHVLINNAGIIQVGPLESMTTVDFHQAMDTHCWGPLNTIQAALPQMRRQRWGRIVNVSSIGGKQPVPHLIPYVASKFALVGLSTALRTELIKEGILVTTVNPGLMRTGSPRNALFKSQHRLEYAWFSISDALPGLSMSAECAARQILRACQNGDAEATLSLPAKLGVVMEALAPNLLSEVLALADRMLPGYGGIGQRNARGYESESRYSPSWITTLNEQAAERNNERNATV